MSNRLYLVPLPDAKTAKSDEGIAAQIQQAGLLQTGGTAVEKIASENIDLSIQGRWDYGETFAQKLADELNSLGESDYSGLPLFDPVASDSGRNKGYYELERVDVNPAHPNTRDTFEYTAALTFTGTKQTHWRAIKTNVETINTGLATGSGGLIGIPATASKVRWFDSGAGKESATVDSTVNAEFGDVDRYDPTEPTFDNPTLLYEVDFADESPVDVRVFDDKDVSKYYTVNSQDFNQWPHVFHTSWEFDGNPIVDNGLIRLEFDEANGDILPEEWTGSSWSSVTLDAGDLELMDADFTKIGPAEVEIFAEFEDTSTGDVSEAYLIIQRGVDGVIIRESANYGVIGSSTIGRMIIGSAVVGDGTITDYLKPIASTQTTDAQPTQTLKARTEVQ